MIEAIYSFFYDTFLYQYQNNEFFAAGFLLATLGMISGAIWKIYPLVKRAIIKNYTTTIEIEDPYYYALISAWFSVHHKDIGNITNYLMSSSGFIAKVMRTHTSPWDATDPSDGVASVDNYFIYPGIGKHLIRFKKKYFYLSNAIEAHGNTKRQTWSVSYFGKDHDLFYEIIKEATEFVGGLSKNQGVWVYRNGRADWESGSTRQFRDINYIYLPTTQKEEISNDINHFISKKEIYTSLDIPFRRGYMFYGPPGNGKTSISLALACYYDFPLYILNPNRAGMTDDDLFDLFANLPSENHILLIEDIDAMFTKTRTDEAEKRSLVTFSGILNAIDGIGVGGNRILIFTTNHPERLDAALTRSGRIDYKTEFKNANREQLHQFLSFLYPDRDQLISDLCSIYKEESKSVADVQNFFLRNYENPNVIELFKEFVYDNEKTESGTGRGDSRPG